MGFEPAVPVSKRAQIYASDRATTRIGIYSYIPQNIVCLGIVVVVVVVIIVIIIIITIIIIIIIIILNIMWAGIA